MFITSNFSLYPFLVNIFPQAQLLATTDICFYKSAFFQNITEIKSSTV